jgi:hypothetical protein
MSNTDIIDIGSRRELFVDDALIDTLGGEASLRLRQPIAKEIALVTDKPWEGNMCGGYKTYFRDGDLFRMYYQAWNGVITEENGKARMEEAPIRVGYLESGDGIHWRRPSLGMIEFGGSTDNNIVFAGIGPDFKGIHGFAPFKDDHPGCPPEARYKAVGAAEGWPTALYALQSPDGLCWSLMREEPIITDGAFDSQNLAFWDAERGEYRAYVRDFKDGCRGIKTCTSPDFLQWTAPEWLQYVDSPEEQLYTNQVIPYYRAPHILVGFPARYVERKWSPSIEALPEVEHRRLRSKVSERYGTATSDGLFMASRDGKTFTRWGEAFIRPGLRPVGSWAYGDCYQGWGLLETASEIAGAPDELSMFAIEGYWRGTANAIRRYTLRLDGFVSANAPLKGGELITKPLIFAGDRLSLNIATSAAGSARVEIRSADGQPLDGYRLEDCCDIIGDTLDYTPRWQGGTGVRRLAGQPVRLRFSMSDTDLYSFRFAAE